MLIIYLQVVEFMSDLFIFSVFYLEHIISLVNKLKVKLETIKIFNWGRNSISRTNNTFLFKHNRSQNKQVFSLNKKKILFFF